jgi:tRNA wybutosine-synthesizing protein 1
MRNAGYYFIGDNKHSAVKICHYTKKGITGEGMCYKYTFYGIRSHRCIQWTPAQPFCNHACRFCWRDLAMHAPEWKGPVDEPKQLVDQAIDAQKFLLNGFGGDSRVTKEKFASAMEPVHTAISLDGEPTLYPRIAELIKEFHLRGITTFLVSNGTRPEAIEFMRKDGALPTQLYVSLPFFNLASYNKIVQPLIKDGWERIMRSLDLLKELRGETRTVLRMTLMKGINLSNAKEYGELIKRSGAEYVEVKSYAAVGKSRQRIGPDFVPEHLAIKEFANELAGETGYVYAAEHVPSKVVLLCKDEKAKSERIIDYVKWCGEKFTKYERFPTMSSPSNSASREVCCGKCKQEV